MLSKKQPGAQDATGGDTIFFNVSQNTPAAFDLGQGYDTVFVSGDRGVKQVRITFTSSEVGNFDPNDSGTLANQDGGLAVRLQGENRAGNLTGAEHRFDDEGIRFVANGTFTFDVRDLVSGAQRGSLFSIVSLGTSGTDRLSEAGSTVAAYINGGGGNDRLTGGDSDDFLVGGTGNDRLNGNAGNDSFIGGAGNDRIAGGNGDDTVILNVSTDGADKINLANGADVVNLSAAADVSQIRLTFTSSEVGNGSAFDGKVGTNQDGGFAVRVQAEGADGTTTGLVTRTDDEGISFIAASGQTFDVRDLVSGTQRGDGFQAVRLGTSDADTFDQSTSVLVEYINGGAGADTIVTGTGNDFLVGGAGDDNLRGGDGNDTFIGGAGADQIIGAEGNDTAIINASTDGADSVILGGGDDQVTVSTTPLEDGSTTDVQLTFNANAVGNDDNTVGGPDETLAVQLQTAGGDISTYDDEGITFVATAGTAFTVNGLTGSYSAVALGTGGNDVIDQSSATGDVYLNGGALSDTLTGGAGNDYLVGGGGVDYLNGGAGNDQLVGGSGFDYFVFTGAPGSDEILDFRSGKDFIDLSSYGITADNVSTSVVRGDTFVFVDSNADGRVDFTITVDNSTVATTDFVF